MTGTQAIAFFLGAGSYLLARMNYMVICLAPRPGWIFSFFIFELCLGIFSGQGGAIFLGACGALLWPLCNTNKFYVGFIDEFQELIFGVVGAVFLSGVWMAMIGLDYDFVAMNTIGYSLIYVLGISCAVVIAPKRNIVA
jgi:hypothetical protein